MRMIFKCSKCGTLRECFFKLGEKAFMVWCVNQNCLHQKPFTSLEIKEILNRKYGKITETN